MQKTYKKNGYPSSYGYLCGYGCEYEINENNRLSMFENDSHTCIDIKGFIAGKPYWEQFYYEDYLNRSHCQNAAENWYKIAVNSMIHNFKKHTI